MGNFIHVDRCDSTQDLLKEQLTQTPGAALTISCEHQTKGRGRGENVWQDSAGTICFSMTLPPHAKATFTALEVSTLVADFFHSKGQGIQLKWPNDLINGEQKKCGGILVQGFGSQYLAGVGVNLFLESSDFGGVYESSFELEKKTWAKELSEYIEAHRFTSTDALIERWTSFCFHLNKEVRIIEGETETRGIFKGLGIFGEALVENESGLHQLYNGSLRLV